MNAAEVIQAADTQGIHLHAKDGGLVVKGQRPPSPELRSLLVTNKAAILAYLTEQQLTDTACALFEVKSVRVYASRADYEKDYPPDTNAAMAPNDPPLSDWLAACERIRGQRDDKGRCIATRSEVQSCIIGIRSYDDPRAKQMLRELESLLSRLPKRVATCRIKEAKQPVCSP